MKQLIAILFVTVLGAACAYGAYLGINKFASALFVIGAGIAFLTSITFTARFGGFESTITVGVEED